MKRSEHLSKTARSHAMMSAMTLMASVAIVCWVPMAVLSGDQHPGGMLAAVAMGALALAGLGMSIHLAFEAIRHIRLSRTESRYEWQREVRPRI